MSNDITVIGSVRREKKHRFTPNWKDALIGAYSLEVDLRRVNHDPANSKPVGSTGYEQSGTLLMFNGSVNSFRHLLQTPQIAAPEGRYIDMIELTPVLDEDLALDHLARFVTRNNLVTSSVELTA
jgi:hypothetical protein